MDITKLYNKNRELINKILRSIISNNNYKSYKHKNSVLTKIGYNGIYHYHIRKTGGTSLNSAFLNIDGVANSAYEKLHRKVDKRLIINDKTYINNNKILSEYTPYFYAFGHRPSHKLNIPNDRFTFTCFREPVSRMISFYKMIYTARKNRDKRKDYDDLYNCLGKGPLEFVRELPKKLRYEQLYMFSPNYDIDEFFDQIEIVNKILFTEKLKKGFDDLNNELNIDLKYTHRRKSTSQLNLDQSQLEDIKEILYPEIVIYNKLLVSEGYE